MVGAEWIRQPYLARHFIPQANDDKIHCPCSADYKRDSQLNTQTIESDDRKHHLLLDFVFHLWVPAPPPLILPCPADR